MRAFDFRVERFVVVARRAGFLHVQRIHERVQNFVAAVFGDLLGHEQRFPRDGVDRFVRLDFSEARVFVAGVAEAADQQPLERVALEFVTLARVSPDAV